MADDPPQKLAADLPPDLARLLEARNEAQVDGAWATFLSAYHKLVLYAIRSTERDRDVVMDCYAYVLDQLRRDDFRRLRAFAAKGRAKFTTWLVVVTQRLVLDHRRARYGRERPVANPRVADPFEARRRLADLVASEVDITQVEDSGAANPDRNLSARERRSALQSVFTDLAERDQLLLSLRFQDERSAREIAQIMDYPSPFHVYRRLKAVLEQLRADLESRGIDGAEPWAGAVPPTRPSRSSRAGRCTS